ncbi:DUF4434 domain-containing protein [Dyadobacter frigoris]|uniref:DUF4434 domain-containing protein n=1 Tax=Dyadobacter frigoris TaxID=2576211 RepID=A0A4U6D7U8_9BACT|nr:DUF4434 domain-containing protein [Dyadobacter frigoris]TKT92208.1 DUF4434 domain-containing protein [Dyadobacter frigoris]GLU53379.1 hypothetical protein Dfri01_28400 [Dyadobacter frigoris]
MKKYFYLLKFVLLAPAALLISAAGAKKPVEHPIAKGTFIQNSLVAGWDDVTWQKELGALKEVGMEYLIIAPVAEAGGSGIYQAVYPSKLAGITSKSGSDIVENCLRNAKKAGFKVFIGLNMHEKWWTNFSHEWLEKQMLIGNDVATEVYKNYGPRYAGTFYGWYWVWEIDNLRFNTPAQMDMLTHALNVNLDHLHMLSPGMPFMFCPFMNYRVGTAAQYRQFWEYVFAQTHLNPGDIFAPQDCIGAGGLEMDQLDDWFANLAQAVKTKPGLLFWSDAETFEQRFWTSAPLNRFVEQLRIAEPYVSTIISFAYSHYYSPVTVRKGFHEAYKAYVDTGKLPGPSAVAPGKNLEIGWNKDGKVTLKWQASKDTSRIAGYYLFRNDILIGNIQGRRKGLPQTALDTTTHQKGLYAYSLKPYDFSGNIYPGALGSIEKK